MRHLVLLITLAFVSFNVSAQERLASSGPDHAGARVFLTANKEVLGALDLEFRMECRANGQREVDGLAAIRIISRGTDGKLIVTNEQLRCYTSSNDIFYRNGTKSEWGPPKSILLDGLKWADRGKKFEIIAAAAHSEKKWDLGTQVEQVLREQQAKLEQLLPEIAAKLATGGN